jgi:hypothetical protein
MLANGLTPDNSKLWVYGDDTLIFIKRLQDYVPARVIQKTLNDTYGILAGESNVGHFDSYGDQSGTTFLGCWMKDGCFGRPLQKWLLVSALPEHPRPSVGEQMGRMAYLPVSATCSTSNVEYFKSYFTFVNERLPSFARYDEAGVAHRVTSLTDNAHREFSDAGSDVREWEAGAKTVAGSLRADARLALTDEEMDAQCINYTIHWLRKPPRSGRPLQSSAGYLPKQAKRAYSRVRLCAG